MALSRGRGKGNGVGTESGAEDGGTDGAGSSERGVSVGCDIDAKKNIRTWS